MTDPEPRDDEGARGPRCPRWLSVALVASLGANLLVGGIFIGERLRTWEKRDATRKYNASVVGYLPETRRAEALALLEAEPFDRRGMGRDLIATTEDVAKALTAEPFDGAALMAALAARMDVFRQPYAHGAKRVVALAESLSLEERALLAEGMRKRMRARAERIRARAAGG